MMDEARREARRTLDALGRHLEAGTPVVGLEPSCLFTFRDEYPALFPGDARVKQLAGAELADQYLARELAAGRIALPWKARPAAPLRVHGHCHQKAFDAFDATLDLLRAIPGADVRAIESTCCGMAGAFGHERGHYEASMAMAELALLPAVRAEPAATIVAAGTSCRQQIHDGAARRALHPLVVVAQAL